MVMNSYIRFFDTTLRDGEQSPGATLTSSEKMEVARQLTRLGVDIIEAGFPAASPDDLEAVRRISEEVGRAEAIVEWADEALQPPIICGLARASSDDIDAAWTAIQAADKPRIHTFLATSEIHMKHKLRMDATAVVEQVKAMVAYAKQYCSDVEFSPEDASRTEAKYLAQVVEAAIFAPGRVAEHVAVHDRPAFDRHRDRLHGRRRRRERFDRFPRLSA